MSIQKKYKKRKLLVMKYRLYIGTYTEPIKFGTGEILQSKGKGIIAADFNAEDGKLEIIHVNEGIENPSFLTLNSDGTYLFAVNELKVWEAAESGTVSSFKVERESGRLEFLSRRLTYGTDPCHVAVANDDRTLYVSNFMSGSVCVLPILEDGSLSEASQRIQHTGSSLHPLRQKGPHAHSCIFDQEGKYAIVPDLGIDKLMVYQVDERDGSLLEPSTEIELPKGYGPRSGCFNKAGNRCYIIQELASGITVYEYQMERSIFRELQYISSIPKEDSGDNICAHIQMTPDEKFLFGSNRGHDSIVTYKINEEDGTLTYLRTQSCMGKTPRHFSIDPTGRYLLVANQDTDQIITFRINQDTGELKKVNETAMGTPVCIRFVS